MTESEYLLRKRVYEIGKHLRDVVLDESDPQRLGCDLIELSAVCDNCNGTGQDGDPPDAAGVGGGFFDCEKCKGLQFLLPQPSCDPSCGDKQCAPCPIRASDLPF